MCEMIHARREGPAREERYDLFSSLLDASKDADVRLQDSELIGASRGVLV